MSRILFLYFLLLFLVQGMVQAGVYPNNHMNVQDSTVTFAWNPVTGATGYELQITKTSFSPADIDLTGLTTNSKAVTNLVFGNYYYWRVRATGSATWSQVDTFGYFNAASFPGLSLWLKADGKVIKDAFNNVSGWVNEAPNTADTIKQTVQSKMPAWGANASCNHPMLQFNSNKFQDLVAPGSFQNIGSNSKTMFCVGQAFNSAYSYFAKSEFACAANRYALWNAGGTLYSTIQDQAPCYGSHNVTFNTPAPFTDLATYEIVFNRNAGTSSLYGDDFLLGSTTGVQPTSYNYVSNYPFYIGAYDNASGTAEQPGFYLNGNIGEIVFYDSAFSDAQRMQVSQYLMDKYAPPVNLGTNAIVNNFCPDTLRPKGCYYTSYKWFYNGSEVDTTAFTVAKMPGTYLISATDLFSRNSIDSIQVIEPNPNFTGANTKICFGDTVVWNTGLDSTVFTFLWSNGSKKSFLDITTAGTYSVTVTGPGGCSLASKAVTFTVDSFALETSLGTVDSFCSGNLLSLQQGAGLVAHYQWSTSPGDTLSFITLTNSGTYKVTLTDAFSCKTIDSIQVVIKGVGPVANFTADTVCLGAPTQFTDLSSIPSPYTITAWKWNLGNGIPNTQKDPTYTYAAAGVYSDTLVTISNTGCISTPAIRQVLVRPTVQAFFTDSLACTGDSTRFFNKSAAAPGDSLISWFWNFGGSNFSTRENSEFKFPAVGTDTVSLAVSTAFGCRDTFKRAVQVVSSAGLPGSFALLAPVNNTNLISAIDTFAWQPSANAVRYKLKVSTDAGFRQIAYSSNIYSPKDSTSSLPNSYSVYYWQVTAFNLCGDSIVSPVYTFTVFSPAIYLGTGNNPSFWVMADGPLVKTSGRVTQWTDQSGNGNNVYQLQNVHNAPVWDSISTPILNNRPVLFFDGTDSLYGKDTTVLNLNNHSRTAFVIGKSTSATGSYFAKSYYGAEPNRYSVWWNAGTLSAVWSDASPTGFTTTLNPVPGFGNYELITWVADRNNTNSISLIKNSIDSTAVGGIKNTDYNFTSPYNFLVGAQGWGSFSPGELTVNQLNGNIAEIIFFDTILAPQDYDRVKRYLYIKYGGGPLSLGPDINIAYGFCDHIVLDASNRYVNYQWSTGDTTQTINTASGGAFSVTVTDVFQQVYSASININRPQILLPADTTFCLGDSINLDVNLGSGYHYLFSTGDTTPSLTISTPGKYWVRITDTVNALQGGPCFISDTINVTVDSFRVLASLGPDTTLCRGQYIGLQTDAAIAQSYQWSGGSNDSTLTIDSAGTYKVTVTSVNGCVAFSSIHVNTSGAVANVGFSILPAYCIGDTVRFHSQSTIISPFKILDYQWQFGDGGSDTGTSPFYYYAAIGHYNVTLTVVADSGCVKSITEPVAIFPLPSDSFTYGIGCAGGPMNFQNKSVSIFADHIDSSIWAFGDNTFDTVTNAQHTFAEPGLYAVNLEVITHTGCKQSFTDTVQVFPQLKVDIGADHLCEGQTVQFHDASPGFSNVAWIWNFPDNTSATDSNPTKTFNPIGQYVISLIATNAIGCVTADTDTITIFNPPVPGFNNPDGCVQLPYQFSDLSLAAAGDSILSQVWNFGDASATSPRHRPLHQFAGAGIYDVTLTVTTQHGCQDSITLPVNLLGPPTAAFTFSPTFGGAPLAINFSNKSTGAINYFWNFGDGATSTETDPAHTYTQDGIYNIQLVAVNDVGCSDTAVDSVKVIPTSLDLAILFTNVTHDTTGRYNLCAFIVNVGTRTVYNFDIVASLGGASTIIEHVNDTLFTGDTLTYCFYSHYFTTVPDNQTYVCINTMNPDSGTDQNPANNIICTALQDDIRIMAPYPNPAKNEITLGAVLPSDEPLTITLYDDLGKKIGTVFTGTATKGFNQWTVNTGTLAEGDYYFLILYKQDYHTVKFMIQR